MTLSYSNFALLAEGSSSIPSFNAQTLPAGSRATSCQAGSHWLLLPVCPFHTVGLHHALRDFRSWKNAQSLTFPTCGRLLIPAPTAQRVRHTSGQRAPREGRFHTCRNPELGGNVSRLSLRVAHFSAFQHSLSSKSCLLISFFSSLHKEFFGNS